MQSSKPRPGFALPRFRDPEGDVQDAPSLQRRPRLQPNSAATFLKICLIATALENLGGAERQVVDLADFLVRSGHEVVIVALTGDVVVAPSESAVRIHALGMRKTPVALLATFGRAAALLVELAPDVVHSHMVHANIFARLLRLRVPMPRLICTAHSSNEGGKLRMLAYRLTDPLADVTTNVSQEAVRVFLEKRVAQPGKLLAVYNGIDTQRFAFSAADRAAVRSAEGVPEDEQVVLSVGRLTEAKDFPNLVDAFAILVDQRPKCRLWIVGEGPLRQLIEARVAAAGVQHRVSFMGSRRDIPRLMSACDVYVLSSSWEGFGLVAAEAMACERPVVSTDSGGPREIVDRHGWIVPVRRSDLLASAIGEALGTGAFTKEAGAAARARVVERFSMGSIGRRWLELYGFAPLDDPDAGTRPCLAAPTAAQGTSLAPDTVEVAGATESDTYRKSPC